MKKILLICLTLFVSVWFTGCQYLEEYLNPDGPGPHKARTFNAFLSGNQEVPVVNSTGAGTATFTLNKEETQIAYKLYVYNIDKILFAHIHLAPLGRNGDIVAFLLPMQTPATGVVNGILAEGVIKQSDLIGPLKDKPLSDLIKELEAGTAYVNVHTEDFRPGELRGQIYKANPKQEFSSGLTGSQEVPPVTTNATGKAVYKFNEKATEISFRVDLANIENVRFAHIHIGPPGINGPIVLTLKMDRVNGPVNGLYVEGKATELEGVLKGAPLSALKTALETGVAYTNVHTDTYPGGEVRGQIR